MAKDYRRPSEQDVELLMCHLLRSQEVIQAALPVLKIEAFTPIVERKEQLLWAISSQYYVQYRAPIPEQVLVSEIQKRTAGSTLFDNATVAEIYERVYKYFNTWRDMPPCAQYVIDVLNSYLYFKHIYDELELHFKTGTGNPEMINAILERSKLVEVAAPLVVEPFAIDQPDNLELTPRFPTGLFFLDMMLDGGARPGEAYGFIAPSGGGKTTLSNQLAIEYASRGNHVFVFTYEQPINNDYLYPVRVCASRIPRDRMKSVKSVNDFTEAEKLKFYKAKELINRYLHFVDFSGCGDNPGAGAGGITEVERVVERYTRSGVKPGAVLIDWFWPMVLRASPDLEEGARRAFAKNQILQFKQMMGKSKCWGWLNQQLTSADAGRKKTPEWNAAAELKSFAEYLDFCFTLGMLVEGKGTIKSSKARGAAVSSQTVVLDGQLARFEGSDMVQASDGRYVVPGQERAIPAEKIPVPETETRKDFAGGGAANV
jgi:hypothetical protein